MKRKFVMIIFSLTLLVLMLSACSSAATSGTPTAQPAGQVLLETRCTVCHGLTRITIQKNTQAGWDSLVSDMIARGAILTDAEKTTLVQYLATTYGK